MKKRFSVLLFLLCMLLSGCGNEVVQRESDATTSYQYEVSEENRKKEEEVAELDGQSDEEKTLDTQSEADETQQQDLKEEKEVKKGESAEQIDESDKVTKKSLKKSSKKISSISVIPEYSNTPYVAVNDNVPNFSESELTTKSFETYSELDRLGRCGVAYACIGQDLMPTEERGSIGQVKPSGWHTVKYDCVDGKYLYNRCHLIGYQLSGENANEKNLITGTRYLNMDGMLLFENMVADYVEETGNHVMYRVTPVYEENNLVASGVQMEAQSVEDDGEGICFNVYCYNVQPGVTIDYTTGDSTGNGKSTVATTKKSTGSKKSQKTQKTDTNQANEDNESNKSETVYITDTGTKYHSAGCRYLKSSHEISLENAEAQGYEPCSACR